MTAVPAPKRVLLKVSGEALLGTREYGLDKRHGGADRHRTWAPCSRWGSRSAW